ncbi:MAG: SprT-like domain-containing protein [Cyclobacteriaceae bacterium]|nr:SprT-like domain-containing protein [Cyclobacteriaceae bacterium]MCK5209236.1 SprT-like domain-containing protein [Cyclobacteriaceae bacterium]MCK5470968.1 SprT-like domain-containing protein [Cyclobacteriaceae bacterium]MCK5701078.1 SprT-like domain-containing protein [Cyclobacteriaceae bacterium]
MESAKKKLYQILQNQVPENAVHYCLDLWETIPFNFKVTRKRNSKLGDYRFDQRNGSHSISVNFDLNQYSFLITYIHELAHLLTTERFGRKSQPHGKEWKSNFRELMEPVMSDLIFPDEILKPLHKHMKNPKASTYADSHLVQALRQFDEHESDLVPLSILGEGDTFEFNNGMYKKLSLRRTRVLCQQADTSRKYLISKMALVRILKKGA